MLAAPAQRRAAASRRTRGGQQKVGQLRCASSVTCSSGFGLSRAGAMAMQRQGRGVAGRRGGRAPIPGEILARMRRHGQPARAPQPHPHPASTNTRSSSAALIDRATLERAEAEAVALRRGHPRGAAGDRAGLAARLCDRPGAPPRRCQSSRGMPRSISPMRRTGRQPRSGCRRASPGGRAVCSPRRRRRPRSCSRHVAALRGQGIDVVLAPQLLIDAALEAQRAPSGSTGRSAACCASSRPARPALGSRPGR